MSCSILSSEYNYNQNQTEYPNFLKLEIRTFEKLEGAFVGSYIHSWNKIATLVVSASFCWKKFQETLLCCRLLSPIALNEEGVDAAVIKEIEIAKDLCVKKVNQK
jgi:elongation factor Ts